MRSLTCAVKDSQHDYLWIVFTHKLREHEYRTFTNGQLTATVWADKAVVIVVYTMFKPLGLDSTILTPNKALQTNKMELKPLLSEEALSKFLIWPLKDLQALAQELGHLTGSVLLNKIY